MIREISRRKCLRLWLCKPEYMGRTKWENRFVLLRFRKKNYMMFLKDLKRFKMERLYDKLKAYSESDFYAFHMPGHKRNKALLGIELPYDLDITEIDGFDDLHHADGILEEEQERAARVFGAEESHFLVNGSTAGILSAVMGCTHRGDKILVARHCHKSIYHAIYMNGLVPRYVYPEFDISMHMNGEISKEDVVKALAAEPDIKAVVIVSPNYDGVVSDVKGIAEVAHSYRIPLIVDEAHGPHFGFHPAFPGRANDLGADVVINSLHKTLPSLTQTAILHINGKIVNRRRIKKYLDMLQSSSPSYIFMASLDACVDFVDGKCEEAFELYVERLQKFREELEPLQHLQILRTEHYDISKVVISTANANITSPELADRLRKEYHLEMEMTGGTYVLAMTTVADTQEGLDRLKAALLEIDGQLEAKTAVSGSIEISGELPRLEQYFTPQEAADREEDGEAEEIPWKESEGAEKLDADIAELEQKLKAAETVKDDSLSQALGVMKKYSGADELTQAMVQELIEKVVVPDPEHVEIVWKFKDEVRKFIGV